MTTHGLTGLTVAHLPRTKGGALTRLSWRGWHVDLDEDRVTVPAQPIAGKNIDDLDLLLGAGYRMLNIAAPVRLSPLPKLRDRLLDAMIAQIVAVLQSAQHLADIDCRREAFDVYGCTSRAWRDAGMSVRTTSYQSGPERGPTPESLAIAQAAIDAVAHKESRAAPRRAARTASAPRQARAARAVRPGLSQVRPHPVSSAINFSSCR